MSEQICMFCRKSFGTGFCLTFLMAHIMWCEKRHCINCLPELKCTKHED